MQNFNQLLALGNYGFVIGKIGEFDFDGTRDVLIRSSFCIDFIILNEILVSFI